MPAYGPYYESIGLFSNHSLQLIARPYWTHVSDSHRFVVRSGNSGQVLLAASWPKTAYVTESCRFHSEW